MTDDDDSTGEFMFALTRFYNRYYMKYGMPPERMNVRPDLFDLWADYDDWARRFSRNPPNEAPDGQRVFKGTMLHRALMDVTLIEYNGETDRSINEWHEALDGTGDAE